MDKFINKEICIIRMEGEPQYRGRKGVVKHVDDMGHLHGTWGGLAVIPGQDMFEVVRQ